MGGGEDSGMSRRVCERAGRTEAKEEWLRQGLLYINPSLGSLWQTYLIIRCEENGTKLTLTGFPADGGTNATKAGLRRRGGSLTG